MGCLCLDCVYFKKCNIAHEENVIIAGYYTRKIYQQIKLKIIETSGTNHDYVALWLKFNEKYLNHMNTIEYNALSDIVFKNILDLLINSDTINIKIIKNANIDFLETFDNYLSKITEAKRLYNIMVKEDIPEEVFILSKITNWLTDNNNYISWECYIYNIKNYHEDRFNLIKSDPFSIYMQYMYDNFKLFI